MGLDETFSKKRTALDPDERTPVTAELNSALITFSHIDSIVERVIHASIPDPCICGVGITIVPWDGQRDDRSDTRPRVALFKRLLSTTTQVPPTGNSASVEGADPGRGLNIVALNNYS